MLPNLRLSGVNNSSIDSMGDFLGVSTVAAAAKDTNKNMTAQFSANRFASAVSQNHTTTASTASSGWGVSAAAAASFSQSNITGASKTLADYVRESAGWQAQQTTSMPWAAAVKAPSDHHHSTNSTATTANTNSYDANGSIGSWTSPETSSSARDGWNVDGTYKNDGNLDDGTAIWGNPSAKKTGIDWTEKEALSKPPQAQSSSEKRTPKPEPTISSLNGTEAWGAPAGGVAPSNSANTNNSQQQSKSSDKSGNNYGVKSANEQLGWGESSSLQAAKIENSSPPNISIWNHLGSNQRNTMSQHNSSDWLSSSTVNNTSIDDLDEQLKSTNLLDGATSTSSSTLTKCSSSSNNPNLKNQSLNTGKNLGGNVLGTAPGSIGGSLAGSNSINDLKQFGTKFSNDLLESPNRQQSSSSLSASNNQQSQYNPLAYSLGVTPSRDLLKQMVHQIQLAVQAGHLNAHILNQPMSTPTLQLVYTLLHQIKLLQQFKEIQQRSLNKSTDINASTNLDLQINRFQQNISVLQRAITQQQAALTKNETLVDSTLKQQQMPSNYSYATVLKPSTNIKVPSNNLSSIIGINTDSFRKSNLVDTLSNSNSDLIRSSQANYDANATIDKNLSQLLQASSSANNILNKSELAKAHCFTSGKDVNQQQSQKNNLLSSQSSLSAWSAFNSSDFATPGWPRISSSVSQHDQQYNSDLMSDFEGNKSWRALSSDGKDMPSMDSGSVGLVANLTRPNSASTNLKQISENDIMSKDSLNYDWSSNTSSPNNKRDLDAISSLASSLSSSAIGGLSLQSNPWLFAPTSTSLNIGNNLTNKNGSNNGSIIETNNKRSDRDKTAGDSLNFLKPNNSVNMQRSSSGLYDWGDFGSPGTQFNSDNSISGKLAAMQSASNLGVSSGRPAPPPGLMSNYGKITDNSSSVGGISSMDKANSNNESQAQSREPTSSNLWKGNWFD